MVGVCSSRPQSKLSLSFSGATYIYICIPMTGGSHGSLKVHFLSKPHFRQFSITHKCAFKDFLTILLTSKKKKNVLKERLMKRISSFPQQIPAKTKVAIPDQQVMLGSSMILGSQNTLEKNRIRKTSFEVMLQSDYFPDLSWKVYAGIYCSKCHHLRLHPILPLQHTLKRCF